MKQHRKPVHRVPKRTTQKMQQMPDRHSHASEKGWPIHASIPVFAQQTLPNHQNMGSLHASQISLSLPNNTSHICMPPNIQNSERSRSPSRKRKWSREDALKAIRFEEDFYKQKSSGACLVIRFPDPPLNPDIVKGFSNEIDRVHFQNNSSPRYCFVRLKSTANIPKVLNDISKIPFGVGFLSAEMRVDSNRVPSTKPELIDPYTLYVGNLPLSATVETMKQHFPNALRYDLAFGSKKKSVRSAFVHFEILETAIDAIKKGLEIDGRKAVLRFRRTKLNISFESSICSIESEANQNDSNTVTVSTNGNARAISGNNIDKFSIEIPTSNQHCSSVIDLTTENSNISGNNSRNCCSKSPCLSVSIFKTEKPDEDKNTSIYTLPIKEELYDSEYSFEDDCSNSYNRSSLNNFENTNIKTEVEEQGRPCISNCTRKMPFKPNGNGDYAEYGGKSMQYNFTASVQLGNCQTNGAQPESVPKTVHVGVVLDKSRKDDFKPIERKSNVAPITSLSEKKYIENLYDQLNSAKVFKKEARSAFDELEEMLKEFD